MYIGISIWQHSCIRSSSCVSDIVFVYKTNVEWNNEFLRRKQIDMKSAWFEKAIDRMSGFFQCEIKSASFSIESEANLWKPYLLFIEFREYFKWVDSLSYAIFFSLKTLTKYIERKIHSFLLSNRKDEIAYSNHARFKTAFNSMNRAWSRSF